MKQPLDHQRSRKKPVRKAVWIAGDTELADELSELEASLARAKFVYEQMVVDNPRREAAFQTWTEADESFALKKEEVRATAIQFIFKGLSPEKYDDLLGEHPPTTEQIEKAKLTGESVNFNYKTLPLALICACCIEPDMDPEDLRAWLTDDTWNQAEISALFQAATECNQSRKILNLGKG